MLYILFSPVRLFIYLYDESILLLDVQRTGWSLGGVISQVMTMSVTNALNQACDM